MPDNSELIAVRTSQAKPGDRFGRLTVTGTGRDAKRRYYVICNCDCGASDVVAQIGSVRAGTTVSCGCSTKDRMTTHGASGHPAFSRWQGMMRRCYSERHSSYANYGGRGIKVCDEWHDPRAFLCDMGETFSPELQLDRIDPDGSYSPENCRWISQAQNLDNKRRTRRFTHQGKCLSLKEWSIERGFSHRLLAKRVLERGWSIERALTTPVLSKRQALDAANAAKRH